jgi:hypothetical protein
VHAESIISGTTWSPNTDFLRMTKMQQTSHESAIRRPLSRMAWTCFSMLFWTSFSMLLMAIAAASQTVGVLPISAAIRNRPDYSAAHHGDSITFIGVTDGSHDVGSRASLANVEDANAGIALFGSHAVLPPFRRGDVREARGKLSQYAEWRNYSWRKSVARYRRASCYSECPRCKAAGGGLFRTPCSPHGPVDPGSERQGNTSRPVG